MSSIVKSVQALIEAIAESSAVNKGHEVASGAAALELLLRVVESVLAQPRNEKLRRVRQGGKTVRSVLGDAVPEEVWAAPLCSCGWVAGADTWLLPSQAPLFPLELLRAAVWEALSSQERQQLHYVVDGASATQQAQEDVPQRLLLDSSAAVQLILQWLPLASLARTEQTCRHWCSVMTLGRSPSMALALSGSGISALERRVSGGEPNLEFSASCWLVLPGAADPLEEFSERVRFECVAGGDARVSRVDAARFEGFGRAELARLVGVPTAVSPIDAGSRALQRRPSLELWSGIEGGEEFWTFVYDALRATPWTKSRGVDSTWTERSSQGGIAQLLICRRIAWVFESSAGSSGRGGADAPDDEQILRWTVAVDVTQHLRITR